MKTLIKIWDWLFPWLYLTNSLRVHKQTGRMQRLEYTEEAGVMGSPGSFEWVDIDG